MVEAKVKGDSRASSVEPEAVAFAGHRSMVSSESGESISVNLSTRGFEESLRSGQANILVAVRTRPISSREKAAGAQEAIKVLDGKVVVLLDSESSPGDFLRKSRSRERRYAFDHAFDENCVQRHVYEHTAKNLIQGVSNGFNASVFAYGATGAGKTYTMTGTHSQPVLHFSRWASDADDMADVLGDNGSGIGRSVFLHFSTRGSFIQSDPVVPGSVWPCESLSHW
jgi:kinesin family protein 18/19